ncbi:alkyl-dihydroxyacetonephosphate synthase [Dictyostelium discoideum AX4]|uniref:Alkyldihydroxyacetonephosphate synthase n=1 Tax=Dictyostelium discoideum TaxID=44689 RepID=ADAS_DICDI|nr:alkyl-dihydroxyacetonephosphate synthase [Dictyostelium discoideum AX4]O96759.1 RecName: Full=Alkyldihydroxyacetonephosphate synthase; Short=Alkyl-DHAP synthase; AltName: Full=Alkylglycerone-phosphate synthase [Dictyostelium discoideum]EAL64267.1 alkyl-dihydroxyacetonephosphate synthase [Dictyostelium discoideum AX4]CAA09333.1 alkyl-dihydroxyacetonephosphate synthase [Dictyostelium discoideum]|eukprot:XP_637836.1 alkyl-dihydroxyacetonephosphate synthase [Dictyostelium discoideum AX4]
MSGEKKEYPKEHIDLYQQIKWNGWGDTRKFLHQLKPSGTIAMTTPEVSSVPLPSLRGFIKKELTLPGEEDKPFVLDETPALQIENIHVDPPKQYPEFVRELKAFFLPDQLKDDKLARITHTFGKSLRDLIRVRIGQVKNAPDLIVLPHSHEEVERLVQLAHKYNVVIIPMGGGSNIVGAIEPVSNERFTVSIDMRRMNKVLWVDRREMTACIQVGIMGPELEKQLHKQGVSLGHDPDSFEFSTLGGWLATCSSGHQSDKYGDIEDMAVSFRTVTPTGTLELRNGARSGAGINYKHIILGSEGTLGIITEAVMKVHAVPQAVEYYGFLFPTFAHAVSALQQIRSSEVIPTMIRVYDPEETQLSFAWKPSKGAVSEFTSAMVKKYLHYIRSFDFKNVCLSIIGFEGPKKVVDFHRTSVFDILSKNAAFGLGSAPGKTWAEKRYDLPYIRDFLLDHNMWVDVAETTVSYANLQTLWKDAKQTFVKHFKDQGIPAWICAHISHTYTNGVCLYFIFASKQNENKDMAQYIEAKKLMTDIIFKYGGSLSHHHGVGYEHVPWMTRYATRGWINVYRSLKETIDPKDICNPRKLIPTIKEENNKEPFLFDVVNVKYPKL